MPLKSNIENERFQVYFCTRARKDTSVNYNVRPETCILRCLSMFFSVRNCHVEDVKHIRIPRKGQSITQLFIYHVSTHNLRSQIFRNQLLVHLNSDVIVLLLRCAELEFANMYGFFPSGCTIELKAKLKMIHEKSTIVTDGCFENAAIELIRKIKQIQGSIDGKTPKWLSTFPIIYDKDLTALTFDLTVNDINVESVVKVPGVDEIAVKLRKHATAGNKHWNENRSLSTSKSKMTCESGIPLAVAGIELRLRKTVLEPVERKKLNIKKEPVRNKKILECKSSGKKHTKDLCEESDNRIESKIPVECRDLMSSQPLSSPTPLFSTTATSSVPSSTTAISPYFSPTSEPIISSDLVPLSVRNDPSLSSFKENCSEIKMEDFAEKGGFLMQEVTAREIEMPFKPNASDPKFRYDLLEDFPFTSDNEFMVKQSRTYAVCIPGKWSDNGEKLIYIKFPEESDHLIGSDFLPTFDIPCSGFSTPSTFNLSEEYKSPIESPSILMQYQQQQQHHRNIYPEPCPIYPIETSFPPVDLPVEFSI